MKYSIRKKFTIIFVVLIAVLVLTMLVFYSFFLQGFYKNQKTKQLEAAYETVDNAVKANQENGESLLSILKEDYDCNAQDSKSIAMLRSLSERSNIDIIMMNSAETMVAETSREGGWNLIKLKAYISFDQVFGDSAEPFYPILGDDGSLEDETDTGTDEISSDAAQGADYGSEAADAGETSADTEMDNAGAQDASSGHSGGKKSGKRPSIEVIKKTDNYTLQLFNDKRSNSSYLECWGQFSDGDTYFLMTMPIASMEEGVQISRVFLAGVSAVILVIGAVAIYFTTGLITRPIIDLADISERVSKLDFSARYTGRQKDEIGVLGESMNSMSEKLEQAIAELKDANARLQEDINAKIKIDEMRKEFIADVSHELKTPIAIIEGYAEGLVEGVADDKETRDYYSGIIMDEAGKMNKLVRQLTSLISYEFGENENDLTDFDLNELVRSVLDAQRMRLNEAGANVASELEGTALVSADEFKIEEAFTNYLNNAINHLDGSKIIRISVISDGDAWKLSVYNDGKPIPEESIPKLWDKFYKVDKSRSREYGGSGIGLSIVKAIIESHGGSCGVSNKENGVEFWFTVKKKI